MKYIATIYYDSSSSARSFDDIHSAEGWLDQENNNLEHTTKIEEVDDLWNVVDWYYYTEGAK